MAGWSPGGESFSISDRASSSAQLERGYRWLVACYPRSFRRENTEEIIAVLLATAAEDQRRPSAAEAADLLRGAVRMRLGLSGCPRTVLYAIRLMYLGALVQVAELGTVLLTAGRIQSHARAATIRALGPHATTAVTHQLLARVASAVNTAVILGVAFLVVVIAGWLFLAWANGKGSPYARVGAIVACAFYLTDAAAGLAGGDVSYAPADTIVSGAGLAVGIAAVVLLLMKQSWPYYARRATAR